ncbi:MAG TPA: hypothetical protein VHM90_04630, partial [Phycisphaerae bacterium]|nr:hypothetical protein [Phycisphaerae bacterium]
RQKKSAGGEVTGVALPPGEDSVGIPASRGGDLAEESAISVAPASAGGRPPEGGTSNSGTPSEEEGEENIYEVMKQHMARKQEEIEARNAAMKQGQRPGGGGRPGPAQEVPAPKPAIQRVTNLQDLPGIWAAARTYLQVHATSLENTLGGCTRVGTLDMENNQVTLVIPQRFTNWTNDRARAKLEEALRAVTGLTVKLQVQFIDMPNEAPPGAIGTTDAAAGMAAQRVPPELLDAVKKQPIIKELMKRLDATVTHVEMITTAEAESAEG